MDSVTPSSKLDYFSTLNNLSIASEISNEISKVEYNQENYTVDFSIKSGKMSYQKDGDSATPQIGNVRVAPTEDAVKSGRAFVESTMSGELIKKIQQALISQGFLKITKPTSYFGSKTDAAVRAFQKAKGLKEDGKVGKSTYNVLFSSTTPEADKRVPQEIINIQPKGLSNVTQGIKTPPQITRQGNIQTANYDA